MLRHEITPSAGTESHGHRQLVADVGEVDCASRGRGRCWGCRAGAGGQSRSEGSGKGSAAEIGVDSHSRKGKTNTSQYAGDREF